MVSFDRVDIDTDYIASLCWHGDHLLDVFGTGRSYFADGSSHSPQIGRGYAYKFDSIITSGRYAVLYEAHGTKGLIIDLDRSADIRQLDRPYYHANDYHFPIALFKSPDGRDVVAHCPLDYNTLDIEDVLSGERLTKREYQPPDVFRSNLQASLDGRYLLDRGWVWHPLNILYVYDVSKALEDPKHLDTDGIELPASNANCWEPETATFCGHRLVYSSFLEGEGSDEEKETVFDILPAEPGVPEPQPDPKKVRRILPSELNITDEEGNPVDLSDSRAEPPGIRHLLQVFDLDSQKLLSTREMPGFAGRMMPVGGSHILSFHDHPKLVDIMTGKVVQRWADLFAGPEVFQPSAMSRRPEGPFLAMDPANKRFAIGSKEKVTMIKLKGL